MALLGLLSLAACSGNAGGAPTETTAAEGGVGDAGESRRDGGQDAATIADPPVPPPLTDASVQFQQTCGLPPGTVASAVPFTELRLQCSNFPSAFLELLVVDSAAELEELARRDHCFEAGRLPSLSFDTSRLVIIPDQGHVTWAVDTGDTVLLGVLSYQGPAPGSQGFPLAAVLPKASTPVRALICAPPLPPGFNPP